VGKVVVIGYDTYGFVLDFCDGRFIAIAEAAYDRTVTDSGECAWILGKGKPFCGREGPAPQKRERGSSWLQTVGEEGRSSMATEMGDGLATTLRDGYSQSECYCALYSNCIV
jgi:hypothetical protein